MRHTHGNIQDCKGHGNKGEPFTSSSLRRSREELRSAARFSAESSACSHPATSHCCRSSSCDAASSEGCVVARHAVRNSSKQYAVTESRPGFRVLGYAKGKQKDHERSVW